MQLITLELLENVAFALRMTVNTNNHNHYVGSLWHKLFGNRVHVVTTLFRLYAVQLFCHAMFNSLVYQNIIIENSPSFESGSDIQLPTENSIEHLTVETDNRKRWNRKQIICMKISNVFSSCSGEVQHDFRGFFFLCHAKIFSSLSVATCCMFIVHVTRSYRERLISFAWAHTQLIGFSQLPSLFHSLISCVTDVFLHKRVRCW